MTITKGKALSNNDLHNIISICWLNGSILYYNILVFVKFTKKEIIYFNFIITIYYLNYWYMYLFDSYYWSLRMALQATFSSKTVEQIWLDRFSWTEPVWQIWLDKIGRTELV